MYVLPFLIRERMKIRSVELIIWEKIFSNRMGKPLIVLAATNPKDKYYGEFFDDIVDFDVGFRRFLLLL